ncbi:MAG: hypothetical protein RSE13_00080 [Planktothrix sp. GU0601_MAG3]|nr:MAG: hypothetical protein RSE13_00080 [Planktothrix sp. GU0601_MAG3]
MIGSLKLLPEASKEAIGHGRSYRSLRSVDDFSETPTEQELQPKNDKKQMLQILPTDLSVCNQSLQKTPQPIVKPDEKQEAIEDVRSVDFDKLKEGDILFDKKGMPHQLTERSRQLWRTHRDEWVSRNDLQTGIFHIATVEDIAGLMQKIIKSKDLKQFQWLSKIYGDSDDSLMAHAVVKFPELAEIYSVIDEEYS